MTLLKEYGQKRKPEKTPEPKPDTDHKSREKYLVFVVQKHAARRLHYDLRLEMGGTLKSFAVPKGPSLDPSQKRLAVMVEDHPFDYRNFEGIIPEGNYGAGGIIIWDRGFYSHPQAKDKKENEKLLAEGLKKGDMKFVLAGTKLKGRFVLVKTKWDKKSWLFIKEKDEFTSTDDILEKDRSVVSRKTVVEIARESLKKLPEKKDPDHSHKQKAEADVDVRKAPRIPMPGKINPMLSIPLKKPFNHSQWIFEIKWDGYRAISEIRKKNVLLYSRNQLSLVDRFFPVVKSLQKFGFEAVLDGEIVAVDKAGMPDFQLLQDYRKSGSGHLIYYVFDILYYQGRDLTGLPLIKRKDLLKKILPSSGNVKFSDHIWKDGIDFFKAAKKKGLEGIVAKNSKSLYRPGIRSKDWLKIKSQVSVDCVIVGFTQPRLSRKYFGSLVLGAFEKNRLVYIGHSGGGFGGADLKTIHEKLRPLIRENCPFKIKPPEDMPVTWVKPSLVCEITFTSWTKDGLLRHPVFVRLREDKTAQDAILERK